MYVCVRACVRARVCVCLCVCVCVLGGDIFDDEFVYVHLVCFDVSCFYLESEMYATTVTFEKGRSKTPLLLLLLTDNPCNMHTDSILLLTFPVPAE